MKEDLERKAAELEQTLQKQVQVVRKESEEWVKIAGVALASGLLAYGVVKLLGGKKEKRKTKKVMETLEKEGLLDETIIKKLTQKSEPGLLSRIGLALLPIALNYGKDQFMNKLKADSETPDGEEK